MPLGRHKYIKFCTWNWKIQAFRGVWESHYLNIFGWKCLWEGIKTPIFGNKMVESTLSVVGRNNIFEYLLFKCLWAIGKASKHQVLCMKLENLGFQVSAGTTYWNILIEKPNFAQNIGESGLAGVGTNNMLEYLLFYLKCLWEGMKHRVLHTKLENLGFQGWAGIMYLNIFCSECLWEGINTSSFAHEIGESRLSGVCGNNITWTSSFGNAFGKASKHRVLQIKR